MFYNETDLTNKIPLTFSDFDGVHKIIDIKKFLVQLGQKSLTFTLNVDFGIQKLFDSNNLLINYPNYAPVPFEFSRFVFHYNTIIYENNQSENEIKLVSDFTYHKDFIIILIFDFKFLGQNNFRLTYKNFEVYSILENLEKINILRQMLVQDENLLKEFNIGNRQIQLTKNDPDNILNKMFYLHSMEVIVNNKYMEQINVATWKNFQKIHIDLPIGLSKQYFIYVRNCERVTKTIKNLNVTDNSLIGFFLHNYDTSNNIYEIYKSDLADFTVDYNSYLEILDENNEAGNIKKIILFYELKKPN